MGRERGRVYAFFCMVGVGVEFYFCFFFARLLVCAGWGMDVKMDGRVGGGGVI